MPQHFSKMLAACSNNRIVSMHGLAAQPYLLAMRSRPA